MTLPLTGVGGGGFGSGIQSEPSEPRAPSWDCGPSTANFSDFSRKAGNHSLKDFKMLACNSSF